MTTVARSLHPPVWCVWLLILTTMWMPIVPAAANALPRIADFDLSSDARPEGLRIYLYAHANPISRWDPSGNFSIGFGNAAHEAIQAAYEAEHFDLRITTGTRRGIFYKMFTNDIIKPDIINFDRKTFAEIKPFTIYGVTTGYQQIMAYSAVLMPPPLSFRLETWPEKPRTEFIAGKWISYFNAGGVIFYTDPAQSAIEASALVAIAARKGFTISLQTLRVSFAFVRTTMPSFVASARSADMARVNAVPGFAGLTALMKF